MHIHSLLRILRGSFFLLFIFYPILVYLAITQGSIRMASMIVILAALIHLLISSRIPKRSITTIVIQTLGVAILSCLSMLFDTPEFILQLPVFISMFLLVTFAWTLLHPPSMIERYAGVFKSSFTQTEIRYLKSVTQVWILFFIFNASTVEYIVLINRIDIWAIYSGFVSYLLMGFLFAGEYIMRRYRFREFQSHLLDRLLKRFMSGPDE